MSSAASVAGEFARLFGRAPSGVWAAPGRVNLIGEHTDYNDGFVLPLALQLRVVVAAAPSGTGSSRVWSAQELGEPVRFSVAELAPGELTGWAAYPAGVLWALREAGHPVPDVDLVLDGDVPLGAGLSSSAAVECAVAAAVVELAGVPLDATGVALIARRAENLFAGAPTGVMDQMASMHGRAGNLVFLDTRSLAVELVPFEPDTHGLALLVVDTGAPHTLVSSAYADRRSACDRAARVLGVRALRDVPGNGLEAALGRLPDDQARRRVRHVVTENARVLEVARLLRSGADPRAIGPALTASHVSLRDDFEVSVPRLDIAVEAALAAGAHGARMTGGGFGGCMIALLEAPQTDMVARAISDAFETAGFDRPVSFTATPSDGTRRLSTPG